MLSDGATHSGLLLVACSAVVWCLRPSILCRTFGIPHDHQDDGRDIGTSLRMTMTGAASLLHGQLDLAVGAALGSPNITNILLILGLAALVRPFTVHSDVHVAVRMLFI